MVVRINWGKSIRGALSYNERKVSQNKADLLLAVGFSCPVEDLGFTQKLRRFTSLIERRKNGSTNTLHLSINFPPDEILSVEKMRQIALEYMVGIGFGNQPFLVYKHKDAQHPHVHIVTTNIQPNGMPINTHNLARDISEPVRKALEQQFGLIPAESRKKQTWVYDRAGELSPAIYGEEETKHAITNIVGMVMKSYKFTSLEEFNIVLRHFNVAADGGLPGSRRDRNNGLVYYLLNREGYKEGQGIKASEIYGHPTRLNLAEKYPGNFLRKAGVKDKVLQSIQSSLTNSETAERFAKSLQKKGISLHFDQNRLGVIQELFFVDHRYKAIFSHKDLNIGLNEIYRLRAASVNNIARSPHSKRLSDKPLDQGGEFPAIWLFGTHSTNGFLHILLRPEIGPSGPGPGVPKKKKKKRRGPSL